jgi:hypothetical protein
VARETETEASNASQVDGNGSVAPEQQELQAKAQKADS